MADRAAWERFAARIVRAATDAAARMVTEALAALERRGERSIQLARVMLVRPHPIATVAITHVELECVESGLSLVACLSQALRGARVDVVPGDLVVVAVPRGAIDGTAVVLGVVSTGLAPQPQPTSPANALWEHLLGPMEFRAPSVWLNGPGAPAARAGDPVAPAPGMVTWIAAVSTFCGAPPPADFGQVASGSTTVQIGG